MNSSDYIEVNIKDLNQGGEGVARPSDHPVIFVEGALPGERVKAEPVEKKSNYWRARLLEIKEPSPHRIEPPCPVFSECGGCQLQHLEYSRQLLKKKNMLEDALARIGGLESWPEFEVEGMDFPWYYRNKAQFPVGIDDDGEEQMLRPGFYRPGSHDPVFIQDCLIQHQPINRLLRETTELINKFEVEPYFEKSHRGNLRHLLIRAGVNTSQLQLTFVTRRDRMNGLDEITSSLMGNFRSLWGIYHNINPEDTNVIMGEELYLLAGEKYISEYLKEKKFLIHPASFFQINTVQAVKLYDVVAEFFQDLNLNSIVDAYCGSGSIAIYLSGLAERVIGVEEVPQAILAATRNAQLNNCGENINFIQGKVEDAVPRMDLEKSSVIVDPPRKGLSRECVQALLNSRPPGIIYVSCKPATLARDIERMKNNYTVNKLAAVDMFPHTTHLESVALLTRK